MKKEHNWADSKVKKISSILTTNYHKKLRAVGKHFKKCDFIDQKNQKIVSKQAFAFLRIVIVEVVI